MCLRNPGTYYSSVSIRSRSSSFPLNRSILIFSEIEHLKFQRKITIIVNLWLELPVDLFVQMVEVILKMLGENVPLTKIVMMKMSQHSGETLTLDVLHCQYYFLPRAACLVQTTPNANQYSLWEKEPMQLLNNFSLFFLSDRNVARWLHYLYQAILLVLIFTAMVMWSVVLVNLVHFIDTIQSRLNLTNEMQLSLANNKLSVHFDWRNVKIMLISNLLLPEVFAAIAVVAVSVRSQFWCTISALGLFILWLLDHQRYPALASIPAANAFQSLYITGHVLHLLIWILLLLYSSLLAIRFESKVSYLARITQQHIRDSAWNFDHKPHCGKWNYSANSF